MVAVDRTSHINFDNDFAVASHTRNHLAGLTSCHVYVVALHAV